MRRLLALVLLVQALHGGLANAAAKNLELVVTDPFLEMHSGPGRGFPVVYVIGRDELVTVLYSRTDWYKVRSQTGNEAGCGAPIWRTHCSSPAIRRRYPLIRISPAIDGNSAPDTVFSIARIL